MILLDTFCKAGGAGMGYHRAGFQVVGVDIEDQPNYPFEFHKADALDFIEKNGKEFDLIHASPPCQAYSVSTYMHRGNHNYPDLLEKTRGILQTIEVPYIIENVPKAPMREDISLVGYMFGLKVIRKRIFELGGGIWLMQPSYPPKIGTVRKGDFISVFGKGSYRTRSLDKFPKFKKETVHATWSYAMGIDWMKTEKELAEAIPPAYTEYLGKEILRYYGN